MENENANSSVKKEANAANDSSKKTKKVNNVAGMSYTVKKGQTLYDISMKVYGTSKMVDEIKNIMILMMTIQLLKVRKFYYHKKHSAIIQNLLYNRL